MGSLTSRLESDLQKYPPMERGKDTVVIYINITLCALAIAVLKFTLKTISFLVCVVKVRILTIHNC